MKITRRSPFSGKENTMDLDITEVQLLKFQTGAGLVQNIFPNLSPDEREFLLTGITPQEWADTFGTEEETEEDDVTLSERIGEDNARILLERAFNHSAGLSQMVIPMTTFLRIPHDVGPMREKIHPVTDGVLLSFMDRMKGIEEDFLCGKRKRFSE